jgi:hypothetical protein
MQETNSLESGLRLVLRRLFFEGAPASARTSAFTAKETVAILFLLLAVMVAAYRTMIFSGFVKTPGGGDSALVGYLLEHDWRWLSRQPHHTGLFSPPAFYPQPGTMAYSDLHLGSLPFYVAWRVVGLRPQTAFQFWVLTVSIVNFAAAYLLIRILVKCSASASAIAAVLFAFGSPRMVQIGHPQLLPGYFVVGAVVGLWILFTGRPQISSGNRVWFGTLLTTGSTVAQFYTGYYYFWFVIFCAAPALIYALAVSSLRNTLFVFFETWWRPVFISMLLGGLVLLPAARPYYWSLKQVGGRSFSEVAQFLPSPLTWLYQGPERGIYGLVNCWWFGIAQDYRGTEMYCGIGLLSTVLSIAGLLKFRHRPAIALAAFVSAIVILTTVSWHGFSLWRYIYAFFPGAQAVRVISRFAIFLLLPQALGVALAIDWLARRTSPTLALACGLGVFAEQAGSFNTHYYDKTQFEAATQSVVQALPGQCQTLLFSCSWTVSAPWMHLIGMWAELASGIPTLNGYSGQRPPGWPLDNVAITDRFDRLRLYEDIQSWMLAHPAQIENVCWLSPGVATTETRQSQELYRNFGRVGFWPGVTLKIQTDLIQSRDLHGEGFAVRRAYLALVGRFPRGSELSPAPLEMAVQEIMASTEFRERERFVFEAYRLLFQHDPTLRAWLHGVEDLAAKRKSRLQLLDEWKNSRECQIDANCRGMTTDTVIGNALASLPRARSEHDSLVLLYYCLLGRAPVPPESVHSPVIRSVLLAETNLKTR